MSMYYLVFHTFLVQTICLIIAILSYNYIIKKSFQKIRLFFFIFIQFIMKQNLYQICVYIKCIEDEKLLNFRGFMLNISMNNNNINI